MRSRGLIATVVLAALSLAGCATTEFTSTWRNPEAQPLGSGGKKVAAMVMSQNDATRRAAEDALAREITSRGAQGVPVYTLAAGTEEVSVRAAIEKQGFSAVIVMRPVGSQQRVTATAMTYTGPTYAGFWGGYYGYGWGAPWGVTEVRTDTVVSVETLVYSLEQNKLLWGGQSETTNPGQIDDFVREVAAAAAKELRKQGLIGPA